MGGFRDYVYPVGRTHCRGSRRRPPATRLGVQRLEPRLALAAVEMILVPVGNPGNAADPATGFGRVAKAFQIGKYEVSSANTRRS